MAATPPDPVTIDADALLGTRAVEAGVQALANRNRHHLEGMQPGEQQEAVNHWRELAVEVLSSARAALGADAGGAPDGVGRAVVVFEDGGGDEVHVHVTFSPQLEELPDGAVAGTPAQLAAMSLLQELTGEGHDHDHGEHGHDHEH